jgi:hypothetical protein
MMRSCVSNKDIKEDIALKIKENASDNIMEIFFNDWVKSVSLKKKGFDLRQIKLRAIIFIS